MGGLDGFSALDLQRLLIDVQSLVAASHRCRFLWPAEVIPSVSDHADSAKGEIYVCFEGPLGAHLRAEVHEKIWKGEYV